MNYKLAKQLKDAGFPQDRSNFCGHCLGEYRSFVKDDKGKVDEIKIPTLSELIEACGDKFDKLIHTRVDQEWHAYGDGEFDCGETPDEAVARLWIKLQ